MRCQACSCNVEVGKWGYRCTLCSFRVCSAECRRMAFSSHVCSGGASGRQQRQAGAGNVNVEPTLLPADGADVPLHDLLCQAASEPALST
eukprot:12398061-Karenia_brevis.AAC.1